jgi:hypothetical protein
MGGDFFGEEVMGVSCFERGVPPLRGGLLSFASPKESKQRKGDPGSVPAALVPCATRFGRGLRNSGLKPLRQCSPFIRPSLRCSAPSKGPGKPSGVETGVATIGTGENLIFALFSGSTATGQYCGKAVEPRRFWAPLRGAEQRRRAGGSRLALFEPQASSGKPPGPTSSARNPAGAPTQGSPFLWLLSFGEAKESTPASKAETHANYEAEKAKPC